MSKYIIVILMLLGVISAENECFSQNDVYGDSIRTEYVRSMLNKNAVGSKAANFDFLAKSGNERALYEVKADYILIYFNNPDCATCDELKRSLIESDVLNSKIDSRELKVLSVCVEGETKKWETQSLPESWIDACDRTMSVIEDELYYLPSLPMMYLVDIKYNVVIREATLEQLEDYFN